MDISKIEAKMPPEKAKLGKIAAQTIKKANTQSSCCHNQKHWVEACNELFSQPNIVTEFVPVREWIQCIQNGNIEIAMKLSPDVKTNSEIRARANWLIRELSTTYVGNTNICAYIEEADHLLRVLDALNLVFFHYKRGGGEAVKKYLDGQIRKNIALNTKSHKEAEYLANSMSFMISEEHVEDIFDTLKKIVPIRKNYSAFPNRLPSFYDGEALALKFPIDAILNNQGEIIVWKTLGLDEGSFSSFLKFKKTLFEDDAVLLHDDLLNKVSLLKSKGYNLGAVVEKTLRRYPKATLKDIEAIYNHDEDISTDYIANKIGEDSVKIMGEDL